MALIIFQIALAFIASEGQDTWADNLTIPDNIIIEHPANLGFDGERPDSILLTHKDTVDFQLYNSFQSRLFEYDYCTDRIEEGTVFLKVYEITKGQALSTDRLPKSSSLNIYNPTDSILRFSTKGHFTIYEGDWGKPYAARFELWFKPTGDAPARKLFSKNYIIEGWMR